MSDAPAPKSKRGGSRKHPADCQCGHCPKIGRKKQERPVDGNLARKIKAKVNAERLWEFLIMRAAQKAKDTGNTADLRNALEYLDNRDLGNCTDNVNHMHDKPLEMTVNVSIAEVVRKVRERKEQYESAKLIEMQKREA
jgi:hypothetical protein